MKKNKVKVILVAVVVVKVIVVATVTVKAAMITKTNKLKMIMK